MSPASPAAARAWAELNERQQAFLRALYAVDQEAEHREKAAEWRWIEYGWVGHPLAEAGGLQLVLAQRMLRDQGAGTPC